MAHRTGRPNVWPMIQTQPVSSPRLPRSLSAADVTARLAARPDRMLDVGHAKLAHYVFGRGPDVVLVHGWPLHAATWRNVVPLLANDFTLHLLDLPGTGQSEWSERSRIDVASHAESVRSAVDQLGLSRFAYVAHDSGAAITRLAADGDPRVFAHVMGNTEIPGHVPWQLALFVAVARRPRLRARVFSMMRHDLVRRSPLGFGGCFTDSRYVNGDFGALFVDPLIDGGRAAVGQSQLLLGLDHHVLARVEETHARTTAPSLLIWGPDDPFFPLAKARVMAKRFRAGATLVEIPRAKLFAHEDHADAFADHARAFLSRAAQ